jgi:hypothetical protein
MQTMQSKAIAKIASGTLAAISIGVIARIVTPAVWFWICFEILAALLVAIGCAGELWLHNLPVGKKKVEKDEHHKAESRFIFSVAAGVFMEFLALGHAIPEAVKLEHDVASANERAALVESNNIALVAEIQPRRITEEQKRLIANELREKIRFPINGRVQITAEGYDSEARVYAQQIIEALNEGNIYLNVDIESISTERMIDFGIKYIVPPNLPYEVRAIAKALKDGGVVPNEVSTNFAQGDNLFQIYVGSKPLQK